MFVIGFWLNPHIKKFCIWQSFLYNQSSLTQVKAKHNNISGCWFSDVGLSITAQAGAF
jgi:hypothetical protein